MPRASSRTSGPPKSASVRSSDGISVRSASKKASSKGYALIDRLFKSYADDSLGMIDPEGIEALCSDLRVDCSDVKMLMLSWKMKAATQGFFTLEEWRTGMKALKVTSLTKLKKALPELEKEVESHPDFADFYSYAFQFSLTEENQKSVDIDTICELLCLVLGSRFGPQVDSFIKYLKSQNGYKVINKDQWMGFLWFCNENSFPELQNYDSNQAWPLIIDNFVEWMKEKQRLA